VAFVSGRTDLWAACFTFVAVLLWIRGRSSRSTWAVFSACLILGMFSKELAVMVIPVLICWDLIDGADDSWIKRNQGWLSAALVAVVVVAAIRWATLGRVLGGAAPPVDQLDAIHLLIPRLLVYAKLLVVPWPMSAFYTPYDLRPGVLVVIGTLLAGALFVLASRGEGKRPGLMGLVWTLLFLVPVLGIVRLTTAAAAERFLYIPSFGVCLAAAVLWGRLYRWRPRAALAVSAALVVAFAGATAVRSRAWRDELVLYEDMAGRSPRSFVAHFNLGNELAKAGRIEAAEAHLARAVELAPGRADAWNNLGSVRASLGRDTDAEKAFGEALRLKPEFEIAARNRARALIRLGQPAQALTVMESARAVDTADVPLLIELGTTLADAGDWASAERAFRLAIRAAPDQAKAYSYLGFVYLSWNKPKDAVAVLERAVALDPGDATARSNLAAARARG
jgi:protein O-mannosyl-transferase